MNTMIPTHLKTMSRLAVFAIVAGLLSGCIAAAVHTTTYTVKGLPRSELKPLAEAGDSAAQYELGKSYCCMGPGFDTQTATEWLCKAARQESPDAMLELGRIYSGDISRSPAPGQKLLKVVSAKRHDASAYFFLSRASGAGHPDATERMESLKKRIDADELVLASTLAKRWPDVPCEYDEVFTE